MRSTVRRIVAVYCVSDKRRSRRYVASILTEWFRKFDTSMKHNYWSKLCEIQKG